MPAEIVAAEIIRLNPASSHELQPIAEAAPPEHHPAAVYLASLSPGSRRCMVNALNLCARTLTSGRYDS